MMFAYSLGDMADVKILFGDIVAEEPTTGGFLVRAVITPKTAR
jgi:hypothetical protein